MPKHIAIYTRVSTDTQTTASQLPALRKWAAAQDQPVVYYEDRFSGTTMSRPGWNRLQAALAEGSVATVAVWRLDRLGRTVSGLSKLFEELHERRINLVSLKDGIDLRTAAGRLMANVLASVAAFETECRGERIKAGMAAARAKGKRWGGSKPGVRRKVTHEREKAILGMYESGTPITEISRLLGISRPTIYTVLDRACQPN